MNFRIRYIQAELDSYESCLGAFKVSIIVRLRTLIDGIDNLLINSKVKIYMIHGSKDEVIPLEQMYESFDFLKKLDFEIKYKILENCGHSISAEGTSEGLNFIRKLV